ncbi:hypothetical protein [Clostridium drakei]|uniref:Co-chaperone DjlA N-terminal domain-containing protein n=1 Tax=Clostridium drakei TaxID=332101 RepID=A0A2U8DU02_9CLOT|nr:hypothetical protein [Clostridium drakei]AWI06227.1 hypothetical protein B9W14_17505 [Clostridium drakei]
MFLEEFNKKESVVFINLVQLLANADEILAENEKNLIADYMKELSLTNENIKSLSFQESISELKASTDRIKNIIYFELVGVAISDGSYGSKEIEFLNKLACEFNISKDKQQDFLDYFKKVKDTYDITCVDYKSKIESLKKLALSLL